MKPENRTPKTITLPDDLSPEAAMALYDVVREITEAVWEHYKPQLITRIRKDLFPLTSKPDNFDDEIPF